MEKINQAARAKIMLKIATAIFFSLLFLIGNSPAQAQRNANLDALQILKDFRAAEFDPFIHFITADDAKIPRAFNGFTWFSLGFEYEETVHLYDVINRFKIDNVKKKDVAIHAFVGIENPKQIGVKVLTQKEIAVEYRESKRIRYTFRGKFMQDGKLMRFMLTDTPVLQGTLRKYRRGKLIASTKIQYFSNVAAG